MENNKEKDWFSKNWFWVIPVVIVGIAGVIFAFIISVMTIMKQSDVYQEALSIAKSDRVLVEELGSPINEGTFITGNINLNNDSGNANLNIPVSGPKGGANLFVVAYKDEGNWKYDMLMAKVKGNGKEINLLKERKQ